MIQFDLPIFCQMGWWITTNVFRPWVFFLFQSFFPLQSEQRNIIKYIPASNYIHPWVACLFLTPPFERYSCIPGFFLGSDLCFFWWVGFWHVRFLLQFVATIWSCGECSTSFVFFFDLLLKDIPVSLCVSWTMDINGISSSILTLKNLMHVHVHQRLLGIFNRLVA